MKNISLKTIIVTLLMLSFSSATASEQQPSWLRVLKKPEIATNSAKELRACNREFVNKMNHINQLASVRQEFLNSLSQALQDNESEVVERHREKLWAVRNDLPEDPFQDIADKSLTYKEVRDVLEEDIRKLMVVPYIGILTHRLTNDNTRAKPTEEAKSDG